MNKGQMTCMWIGIIVIALMWLCPPWKYTVVLVKSNTTYDVPTGYYFIFDTPSVRTYHSLRANELQSVVAVIDFSLLDFQCVVVILATGALIYTFKGKKRGQEIRRFAKMQVLAFIFIVEVWVAIRFVYWLMTR